MSQAVKNILEALYDEAVEHHFDDNLRKGANSYDPFDNETASRELTSLLPLCGAPQPHEQQYALNFFCDETAAEILSSMPNRYWFWMLILKSTKNLKDCAGKLTADQLGIGLAAWRSIYTRKYDLNLPLEKLTVGQIASRTAATIILIKILPGDQDEIVFNPIFAPHNGADGACAT